MTAVLAGVLPVFAMIALGWGLRVSRFVPTEAWAAADRITFYVLYPAFLVPAIWRADLTGASAGPLGLAAVSGVLTIAGLALLVRPALRVDGPAFTSVFQGVVRWNNFVFLPVVGALYGPAGLSLGAVVIAALLPVVNVSCVAVLSVWGAGQERGVRPALVSMGRNPIILACAAGLGLNLVGAPEVPLARATFDLLSPAALPMGLLTAGAGLQLATVAKRPLVIAGVGAAKLLLLPVLMLLWCRVYGGDATAQGVALAAGAAPGAAASYVLARQMGGDAPLMAGIVAFTTLASAATIPLVLALFHFA